MAKYKYKTPLAKTALPDLKAAIFNKIIQYYSEYDDLKTKFVIFHGIRIAKTHDGHSIKVYLTKGLKESLVEIDNKYILKLILDSIDNELAIVE